MAADRECNFSTGGILGKRFPEALVHTVHRTRAYGTRPMDSMDLCFRKTLSQNSSRAEIRHWSTAQLGPQQNIPHNIEERLFSKSSFRPH